jgi:hypothetical protein
MALVQDDDIRVPFGKAHDHCREIVENHGALKLLTGALSSYKVRIISSKEKEAGILNPLHTVYPVFIV